MFSKSYQRYRRLIQRRLRRRPLLPFLLAATAAVGCVLPFAPRGVTSPIDVWDSLASYGALGFLIGLQGLAAIWLVSALRSWVVRLAAAGAVIASFAWFVGRADRFEFASWASFFSVALAMQCVFVLLVKMALRWWRPRRGLSRRRLRFSMAGVLALMTAVAILAALGRQARGGVLEHPGPLLLLVAESTLPAILFLIVSLCRKTWLALLVVTLFVIPPYTYWLVGVAPSDPVLITWGPYLLTQVTVTLTWLLGLRVRRQPVDARPLVEDQIAIENTHEPGVDLHA